jgi:hypothetical protein
MGIEIYLHEKTHIGKTLQLKIIIPTKEKSINATGILVWIKEPNGKTDFIVGVKFTKIDHEDKWSLLDYAYDNLPKKGKG